jgi:hypothetical protein
MVEIHKTESPVTRLMNAESSVVSYVCGRESIYDKWKAYLAVSLPQTFFQTKLTFLNMYVKEG